MNVYLQGIDVALHFQDKETMWRLYNDKECGSHCWVNDSNPSDHMKSCAYTPAHQSWKATVKWKVQNQMNGLSPVEGVYFLPHVQMTEQSFLPKSVLGNWWRWVATGLQIIFPCLVLFIPTLWSRVLPQRLWLKFELYLCNCCSTKRKVRMENFEELSLARI